MGRNIAVIFPGHIPLGHWNERLIFFGEAKGCQCSVPVETSSDATTSMEKDTVEVVADNEVTTRFDESLISALKSALPSELVMTTGKVRDLVWWSM